MALITCIECGKVFSDKAKACPNCACPTECMLEQQAITKGQEIINVQDETQITGDVKEKTVVPASGKSYLKTDLLSYKELKDFAFSSILPYINKELNNTITKVSKGTDDLEDVHFYISCGSRIIGVKVELDAYPDVYNIGAVLGDVRDTSKLANKMHSQSYEFAIAHIGIGASEPIKFARRIFLKNDDFYFDYKKLIFVEPQPEGSRPNIRYSLATREPDESWKDIVGFEYEVPKKKENPNSIYLIEKPKKERDSSIEIKNMEFWKNEVSATQEISKLFDSSYINHSDLEGLNQLIRFIAHLTYDYIGLKDAFYYTCNAVDYLLGWFLSDSLPVAEEDILRMLKELISKADFVEDHELRCWTYTAINYVIYLYFVNKDALNECLHCYYAVSKPTDRPYKVIADKLEADFLSDPIKFGYGEDVVNEIVRIQSINSSNNLTQYASLKTQIETDMKRYCEIHNKVISKKYLQELGQNEAEILHSFSKNVYQFLQFIDDSFDDNLDDAHKRPMQDFVKGFDIYRRSLGMDTVIIEHQIRGKYGLFERLDDINESKKRFELFLSVYNVK